MTGQGCLSDPTLLLSARNRVRDRGRMTPTLCIMGGCNGAGKTTLAR